MEEVYDETPSSEPDVLHVKRNTDCHLVADADKIILERFHGGLRSSISWLGRRKPGRWVAGPRRRAASWVVQIWTGARWDGGTTAADDRFQSESQGLPRTWPGPWSAVENENPTDSIHGETERPPSTDRHRHPDGPHTRPLGAVVNTWWRDFIGSILLVDELPSSGVAHRNCGSYWQFDELRRRIRDEVSKANSRR